MENLTALSDVLKNIPKGFNGYEFEEKARGIFSALLGVDLKLFDFRVDGSNANNVILKEEDERAGIEPTVEVVTRETPRVGPRFITIVNRDWEGDLMCSFYDQSEPPEGCPDNLDVGETFFNEEEADEQDVTYIGVVRIQ